MSPGPRYSVTVVFGEDEVRQLEECETSVDRLREDGALRVFHFHTEAERRAFLLGIDAALGYLDYLVLD